MESYLKALTQACDALALPYRFIDRAHNLIQVDCAGGLLIQLNRTPFNNEVMARLCKDKEHSYDLLHKQVRMPHSRGFVDYQLAAEYCTYIEHHSSVAVADAIEAAFGFPVVVKPNQGALGINVARCDNRAELIAAIERIFDHHSKAYDYALLAQQYIQAVHEYRVVCFRGEALFGYERVTGNARFGARYWETGGGRAAPLADPGLLTRVQSEMSAALDQPGLEYVGLDLLEDEQGRLWLIELNSSPRYSHWIEHNGDAAIVALYTRILRRVQGI